MPTKRRLVFLVLFLYKQGAYLTILLLFVTGCEFVSIRSKPAAHRGRRPHDCPVEAAPQPITDPRGSGARPARRHHWWRRDSPFMQHRRDPAASATVDVADVGRFGTQNWLVNGDTIRTGSESEGVLFSGPEQGLCSRYLPRCVLARKLTLLRAFCLSAQDPPHQAHGKLPAAAVIAAAACARNRGRTHQRLHRWGAT